MIISTFTLKDYPMDWPSAVKTLIFPQVVEYTQGYLSKLSAKKKTVPPSFCLLFFGLAS
jgi:hypothetical protein